MQIARLQALFTVLWGGAALAWVYGQRETPAWALLGGLAILMGHALVLGLEFVAQRRLSRHDSVPPPSAYRLWRAWAGEVLAAPRLFCWRQPFRSRQHADCLGPQHRGLRGVVLVHGYVCNRGAWNPWMQRLAQQGRPFVALDLEPVFAGIDAHTGTIDAAVTRMTQITGQAPLLVGHSMGGLAIRAWLRQACQPQRVHRLVTLGTPHQGTWMARWGHTPNARQMRPGGPWLEALATDTQPDWRRYFVCVYSDSDNMVFPPSRAMLEGAHNWPVRGLAHVQMVDDPALMEAVLALLQAPPLLDLSGSRARPVPQPSS